jgi:hypothetical protein
LVHFQGKINHQYNSEEGKMREFIEVVTVLLIVVCLFEIRSELKAIGNLTYKILQNLENRK